MDVRTPLRVWRFVVDYSKPVLEVLGSVADLTQTGNSAGGMTPPNFGSNPQDAKGGSVSSNGQ